MIIDVEFEEDVELEDKHGRTVMGVTLTCGHCENVVECPGRLTQRVSYELLEELKRRCKNHPGEHTYRILRDTDG